MHRPQDETPRHRSDGSDLLLTGASGFLGSHFIAEWLQRHPDARAACLIRAPDQQTASERLAASLARADRDRGVAEQPADGRATAIPGALDDAGWIDQAARWRGETGADRFEVVHCAANLSFRASDRDAVRAANIEGTRLMLGAAERLGAASFNYVSTAYVAGDRDGDIAEDGGSAPSSFSNAYEESKWEAEALVRARCAETGLSFRILRPSIIIAHSVTHRLSALSGFYKVVETMMALGRMPRTQGETILLPVPDQSTLDLIPVDVVVNEMVQLLEAGPKSLNHAYHLTSDAPLPLVEVLGSLSPLAGLSIGRLTEGDGPAGKLADLVMTRLRHYAPYLGQIRRFDRSNVQAAGIARQATIGVDRLGEYVASFLKAA